MKTAGYILFIIGMLGSMVSAASPRPLGPVFFIAAGLCGIGALMVRYGGGVKTGPGLSGNEVTVDSVGDTVREVCRFVEGLNSSIGAGDCDGADIREGIEKIQRLCAVFVGYRERLAVLAGIADSSDIISLFSAGERYVNRSWSALIDGYLSETASSLIVAEEKFLITMRRIDGVIAGSEPRAGT